MKCPRCHSENVNVQVIAEKQRTGCLSLFLFGIFNLLKPTKRRTYAVCQSCGKSWRVKPFERVKNKTSPTTNTSSTENTEGNVKFIRPHRTFYKDLVMKIAVGGQLIKLKDGETISLELPPTTYPVQVKMYGAKPTEYFLVVEDLPKALTFERKGNKIIIS